MVLLIVTFIVTSLASCADEEVGMMSAEVTVSASRGVDVEGEHYTELELDTTVVNHVEDKDITSCYYKLYFIDAAGLVIDSKEMEMPGTAAPGESLSDYTVHQVPGYVTSVRVSPVRIDVVEESSFADLGSSGIVGVILVVGFLWWALKD